MVAARKKTRFRGETGFLKCDFLTKALALLERHLERPRLALGQAARAGERLAVDAALIDAAVEGDGDLVAVLRPGARRFALGVDHGDGAAGAEHEGQLAEPGHVLAARP